MKSNILRFFNLMRENFYNKFFHLIAKHSILPATIFTKLQVSAVDKEFYSFWKDETFPLPQKPPTRFSTVTLGNPINLWSYYFPTSEERRSLRESYSLHPFQAYSEDGVQLCGIHFRHQHADKSHARTLIVFGGNGELYKLGSSAWLFKLLKNVSTPFNIVMFDYRECGASQGKAHSQGLVLDGEAIYQYVHQTLGVPEDQIDLCGFSLGGAIATLVKAKHPHTQGALISNRSFQSLDHAVQGMFLKIKSPISKLLSRLATKITQESGWSLHPLEAWKVISSPKMVICHKKDPVIHYEASLEQGLSKADLLTTCHHIHLKQKNRSDRIRNHHVQPLSFYNDQHGFDVETKILEFLLKK